MQEAETPQHSGHVSARRCKLTGLPPRLDIKMAFLNAMLPGEGADDEVVVILQPPRLLVKLKYVQPDEFLGGGESHLWASSITKTMGRTPRHKDGRYELGRSRRQHCPRTHGW